MEETKKLTEEIRLYLMNGHVKKAFDELYELVREENLKELLNSVITLSSNYNQIHNNSLLGLGESNNEKNRIILALLNLIDEFEKNAKGHKIRVGKQERKNEVAIQIDQLSEKVDYLFQLIEEQNDKKLISFKNSLLWNLLEPESQKLIVSASALEKEGNLNTYSKVIENYFCVFENEFNNFFFKEYKIQIELNSELDKKRFFAEIHGNSKNQFYRYLKNGDRLNYNQIADIILNNILIVGKDYLIGYGKQLYNLFYKKYNIKNIKTLHRDIVQLESKKYLKGISTYIFTESEIEEIKELILNIFENMQKKNQRKRI